jgi:hypothetical protein
VGFVTLTGLAAGSVQASGLQEQAAGSPLLSSRMNQDARELQMVAMQTHLAGVLTGGDITVSNLLVSFPVGFRFFARQIWEASGTTQVSVPDAATTYLWGCADGQIRLTGTDAVPGGWDNRSACRLAKATAAGGVAVLDLSVQHRARFADASGRVVCENCGAWSPTPDVIPAGVRVEVPAGHQQLLFGTLTVAGTVVVRGKLRMIA